MQNVFLLLLFFLFAFPLQDLAFMSVLLALLPVVLCDLPCSIFSSLVSSLSFYPFLFFCSDWLSPSSHRGSVSVSLPCLHFPPSPTAVPVPTGPSPAQSTVHVQPLSSITGGQQQRKQKTNQEGNNTAKNDYSARCQVLSHQR